MYTILLVFLGAVANNTTTQMASPELGKSEQMKAYAMIIQSQAALIKANADAFKTRIDAMDSYQKAMKSKLENEMLYTKTFYDKKQMRNVYQNVQAMSKYGGLTTQKIEPSQMKAKESIPKIVSASYKSSILTIPTTTIKWPAVFLRKEFDVPREKMDLYFTQRKSTDYGPTSFFYYNIYKLRNEMFIILQTVVKDVSTTESIFAKKFLDQAIYEANK